jgi:hypothetical protein
MELKVGENAYEFPFFILVREFTTDPSKGLNLSFHDIVTLTIPSSPDGIAVFTDKAAAEQFRDENAASHQVFPILDPKSFINVLQASKQMKRPVGLVLFDPYRLGKKLTATHIDDIIQLCALLLKGSG